MDFAESGHPIFRATTPLSRCKLKSKGHGKLSIHYCADQATIETIFRIIIFVNQLSLYGAVANMCEECESLHERSRQPDKVMGQSIVLSEIKTEVPLENDDPAYQNFLLHKYEERIERLSQHDKLNLGRDVVVAPDGVLRIAEAIKASWAGKLEIATKELYREGGKKDGVLARVPGESMASYVSRRRRWYRSLTTLDKTFSIPEHLQLEMMMDCAGITDHQQQLARLAATKPLTLETMSLALVQEYPLIHEKELSRGRERPHPVRRPLPHRPSGRFQSGRSPVSRAYWSHADEEAEDACWEDEHDVDAGEDDVWDDAACWGEFGDVVDRMEQDIVCAFVTADCSLSDEDVCEDISECVHAECAAFFGREQARQHGVHVEKVVHRFRPKSELEIKKRREHVEQAKRNSTCRTCGRKGPLGW